MVQIPFYRASIDSREEELIKECLNNANSQMVSTLERDICDFFGSKFAVTSTNGTTAMHLALCAMNIKRGDKIICSVNSYPNVVEVIRHFDAEPILVDIDADSFNISVAEFEKTLEIHKHKKLKAAFISHVAGFPAQMDEIYALAKKWDIKIIDDARRAMGAKYKGKLIGAMDSFISCFQMNPQAKNAVATVGFFITNDAEIERRAKIIRNNALKANSDLDYIYDVEEIGEKCDLNAIAAAYGVAQLEKTPSFIARRKKIAQIYRKELANCPHITLPKHDENHIYTQFIIKIDKNRDDFARKLQEFGIKTALHYIPIHLLSYYKRKYGYKVNDFPNALKNYSQVLSIPMYAALSDDEAHYVCDKIKEIAKNRV